MNFMRDRRRTKDCTGLNEDRAHMIRPKYQLPTDARETPRDIGPDVAAECERPKGIALNHSDSDTLCLRFWITNRTRNEMIAMNGARFQSIP